MILVAVSMGIGTVGFHLLSDLFAPFFALYAGLVFLIVAGLLFMPVFHRVLHRFHLDQDSDRAR